ncbi:hypothetical protein NRIC_32780 [Enterococcus florum]|uniref:Sirohydrochlorin ferrochelatase n=1 Tax=Enterococcus florum TaxID=2480627 RepID=A0A4P5PB67_9ENTE|nr:CbiX/SirB N-terminal domain-containing protein [Enterococcus florum]GCF95387.1 hypothetical protein NRIC_32780 [Enterococcus florum]
MKGIIFVLHGRKNKISTANLSVINKIASKLEEPYEIGLLEGEHQTLEDAVKALLNKQVEEIIFLPILLFPATHAKEELPERAEGMLQNKIPYQVLNTLGTTQAIKEYVIDQIEQHSAAEQDVLLIAHGTPHYEEPYLQLKQLANEVADATGKQVYPAHYHGEHLYQEILAKHPEPLIIQPLFLTSGYLAKKIKNEICEKRGAIDELLPTLQNQPALEEAIIERLKDVHSY